MTGKAGMGRGRRHDALWPQASRRPYSVKRKTSHSSRRQKLFSLGVARNPLKSPESDEGIQGNPRKSKGIQAAFLGSIAVRLGKIWFGLVKFGRVARHLSEKGNILSIRSKRGFGCGNAAGLAAPKPAIGLNAALFEDWLENVWSPPSCKEASSSWTICPPTTGARFEQLINSAGAHSDIRCLTART